MAFKQKEITLKDNKYLLTSFPTTKGMVIVTQLTQVMGPAVASLEGGGVATMISSLLDNLDKVDVVNLSKQIVSGATKQGVEINFEMEFSGEYDLLFNLMKAVVEFNFASVLSALSPQEALTNAA